MALRPSRRFTPPSIRRIAAASLRYVSHQQRGARPAAATEQLLHRGIEADRGLLQQRRPAAPKARTAASATSRRFTSARVRRPSRPWAGRSTPRCRSHTPGCRGPAPRALRRSDRPVGCAAIAAAVAASSSTTTRHVRPPAAPASARHGPRRQHHRRRRVGQHERQPLRRIVRVQRQVRRRPPSTPPAVPSTSSAERSRHSPTTVSGPTPSPIRYRRQPVAPPIQLPGRSSSLARTTTATASGVRATWAANSSGTVAAADTPPPCHSTPRPPAARSAASSTGSCPHRRRRIRRHRRQHPAELSRQPLHRRRVEQSRWRTRQRSPPAPPPSPPGRHSQVELRRPRARPRSGAAVTPRQLQPAARTAAFCSTSITWNSGSGQAARRAERLDQPLERHVLVGVRLPAPSPAPGPAARVNAGSPDRSVRSTSVLTKNPTRLELRRPAARHRPCRSRGPPSPPSRDSSTASAACSTMNSVAPCARASSLQPAVHRRRHREPDRGAPR